MNNKYCVYMFEVHAPFFLQLIFKLSFHNVRKRSVLYLDEMKVVFFFCMAVRALENRKNE